MCENGHTLSLICQHGHKNKKEAGSPSIQGCFHGRPDSGSPGFIFLGAGIGQGKIGRGQGNTVACAQNAGIDVNLAPHDRVGSDQNGIGGSVGIDFRDVPREGEDSARRIHPQLIRSQLDFRHRVPVLAQPRGDLLGQQSTEITRILNIGRVDEGRCQHRVPGRLAPGELRVEVIPCVVGKVQQPWFGRA